MTEKLKCRNCGTIYKGNFCSNCGQNADVQRFTLKYLLKESAFSSLDIEKGFFSTIRTLTTHPGSAIRNYLNGKRLSLALPIRYLIIIGAIATFLSIRYKVFKDYADDNPWLEQALNIDHGFLVYAAEFTTVVNILAIPVFALFSYLYFKPTGFNYAENFILNTYITAHQLFFLILFFPIIEIFLPYKNQLLTVYTIITAIYNVWVYIQFYKIKIALGLLLTVLVFICAYISQALLNYGTWLLLDYFEIIDFIKKLDL